MTILHKIRSLIKKSFQDEISIADIELDREDRQRLRLLEKREILKHIYLKKQLKDCKNLDEAKKVVREFLLELSPEEQDKLIKSDSS